MADSHGSNASHPVTPRIHFIPRKHPAQGIIRKRPLPGIKAISLIDERHRILLLARSSPERRLPPICVAGPLVERQHSRECFQVPHSLQHVHGKIIEHLAFQRTHHVPRSKLQSRFAANRIPRQLDSQLRACARSASRWNFHHIRRWHRQSHSPPPAASPATHSPAPADVADCSETSPHKSFHRRSASGVPALHPASSSRVGPPSPAWLENRDPRNSRTCEPENQGLLRRSLSSGRTAPPQDSSPTPPSHITLSDI